MPETLGHYQLLDRIGAGALGEVFRARDTRVGRTVALKRLPAALSSDEARRAQLLHDAHAAAAVSHPHLASLYEVGDERGQLFLTLEYVPGDTLTKLIAGHPLNPRRAVDIAIQLADALAEAHAGGIVHGDVRPDNVIVTPRGQAKLLETGLARFTGGGALRAKAPMLPDAQDPVAIAALRHLSPEQALGEPVDHRSDIFSLGTVLYEMLTGEPAFQGHDAAHTIIAVVQATPAAPSTRTAGVLRSLDAVVARALAKSLEGRYQSAAEMAAALRAVAEGLEGSVEASPAGQTAPGPAQAVPARTPLRAVLVTVVVAFVLVLLALLLRGALGL